MYEQNPPAISSISVPEEYELSREMSDQENADLTLTNEKTSYNQPTVTSINPPPLQAEKAQQPVRSILEELAQPDEQPLKDEFINNFVEGVEYVPQWAFEGLFNTYQSALARLYTLPIDEDERNAKLEVLNGIVFHGNISGMPVSQNEQETLGRWQYTDFLEEREIFAEIFLTNPELALSIAEKKVVGAHGSTSASLQGVLDHGLRPQEFVRDKMPIASGEGIAGSANLNDKNLSLFKLKRYDSAFNYAKKGGSGISEENLSRTIAEFSRQRDQIAEDIIFRKSFDIKIQDLQSTLDFVQKPDKTDKEAEHERLIRESYPIVYFVGSKTNTRESITWELSDTSDPNAQSIESTAKVLIPRSDLNAEFCVEGGVPVEGIPMVFVPANKVEEVTNMVSERGLNMQVFSTEELIDL